MITRKAAVAGLFYPADKGQLQQCVEQLMASAKVLPLPPPRALIVPHAGYIYSGDVAAAGYASLHERLTEIERVILVGPNHRVAVRGIAAPAASQFSTPLGTIGIDQSEIQRLANEQIIYCDDAAHQDEHSLETQLPFLQLLLKGPWSLIPLLAGDVSPQQVARLLARYIENNRDLVVVSSDLSHFHNYDQACQIDRSTAEHIKQRAPRLTAEQACGHRAINGLLTLAGERKFDVVALSVKNSGDTAGNKDRVVGYGSFAVV